MGDDRCAALYSRGVAVSIKNSNAEKDLLTAVKRGHILPRDSLTIRRPKTAPVERLSPWDNRKSRRKSGPGTPLWRLLNTAEGQRLYHRGRKHWEEVREIVNTQKRVATVWHRNYGPMLLHHATRTAMLPHVPLPQEVNGIELRVRAAKLVTALEPFSSKELIRALHETLPLFTVLQGKTLLEIVEFFEASEEMQHA